MKIFITEEQFKSLISKSLLEGINYNRNGDWNVDVNIDSDQTDLGNTSFDTRLFGTAQNILNGDNTRTRKFNSFKNQQESSANYIRILQELKDWVENGRNGKFPDISGLSKISANALNKSLKLPDEELLQWIETTLARVASPQQVRSGKYNRAIDANAEDKIARYNVGVVPGTNLKVICLFEFNDFNVSDVIKNGYMRQNDTTDEIFGISKDSRPLNPGIKGNASFRNVPVSYNGVTPDIQKNFSLNGIEGDKDHFNRVSYGFNDKSYHSVAKFIDKSVNYAQYALKQEDIDADFILSAPSSSKFNVYYAKRLQDKTGIPFINGFFNKKIVNVHFDKEGMEREGISSESINDFEMSIKKAGMKEISDGIGAPIRDFINKNWTSFESVSFDLLYPLVKHRGRKTKEEIQKEIKYKALSGSKIQKNQLYYLIASNAFNSLSNMIMKPGTNFDDNTSRVILNELGRDIKSNVYNTYELSRKINTIINNNCLQDFTMAIRKTAWLIAEYHNKLLEGFTPNFEGGTFKVTKFSKNVRKYLKGAFIIADEQLNKDKNLFTRYAGKKYIIFDEDMNSGATLAMLGDTLMDYGIREQDITCLVNGYSSGGF